MSAQTLLRHATGLNLTKAVAERAVRQRMEATGNSDHDAYLATLDAAEMTALVELVVVPESWLFRDAQAFVAATEFVQRRLADGARAVRILSVPCAGGEEPYSMAMALCDAGVPPKTFTIDAYDLSPACVARATSGVYGRNAFRAQDLAFRDRYFTQVVDEDYQIADSIRRQVRFQQGNLLTLDIVQRARYYDVIFCRNLLIYFDKPTTKTAIGRLAALLADDGVLFAGYAEVPSFTQHGFSVLPHRLAFGLKKDAAPAAPAAPAAGASQLALGSRPRGSDAAGTSFPRTREPIPAPHKPRQASKPAAAPKPVAHAGKTAPAAAPSAAALLEQARALADRGQQLQAIAACQACLAAAPDSAEAYFILGMLSENAQQPAEAEDYWRRCIYLQPDHYEALCHLALLAEQNGNGNGAAALKARAARIYQRQRTTRAES